MVISKGTRMNTSNIERHFAAMGARFKMKQLAPEWVRPGFWRREPDDYAMDIEHDQHGAFFELRVPRSLDSALEIQVMQADRHDRHLLLFVRKDTGKDIVKDRFLCGHDERDWFVAAVPGGASSVAQAKEALKPAPVIAAQARVGLNGEQRNRRANRAFRRQGEWFFVEEPGLVVDAKLILRDEPLSRGRGSKPHMVAELYRTGGETVYVHQRYPNGVNEHEYKRSLERKETRASQWRTMRRNAGVFVRGTVRHADHQTITLHTWHQVLMNTEAESRTMANVAFLD
jgi:hypothetical protein